MTSEQREAARIRNQRYNAKPEVKERRKEYYRRPEVQERYKARAKRGDQKEYMKEWRQSEKGKRALKDGSLKQRGWTVELWETMMKLQGGRCAVCRNPFADDHKFVHADHCHDEMIPRGLLCQACNHAEGQIKRTGLTPEEFGRRLSAYLGDPPAAQLISKSIIRETSKEGI